ARLADPRLLDVPVRRRRGLRCQSRARLVLFRRQVRCDARRDGDRLRSSQREAAVMLAGRDIIDFEVEDVRLAVGDVVGALLDLFDEGVEVELAGKGYIAARDADALVVN